MTSGHRAVSGRLPCAAVRPAVPAVPTGVRPGPRPPPGSAKRRTAVWPRVCWPASAVPQPRACASVAAYCPSRRTSCRSPGSCAAARPSASAGARPGVPCTWNLSGTGRSGTASRRCCLYCAIAYGREGCPSAGNSCHILCTRMDVHLYGNACDSRDVPVTDEWRGDMSWHIVQSDRRIISWFSLWQKLLFVERMIFRFLKKKKKKNRSTLQRLCVWGNEINKKNLPSWISLTR